LRKVPFSKVVVFMFALLWVATALTGQSNLSDKTITVHIGSGKRSVSSGRSLPIDVEIANPGEKGVLICSSIIPGAGLPCRLHLWIEDVHGSKIPELTIIVDMPPPNPNETLTDILLRLWLPLKPKHALRTTIIFYPNNNGEPLKPGQYRIRGSYSSYGLDAPGLISPNLLKSEDLSRLTYPVFQGRVNTNSIPILITSPGK
jgi:hypothetical protein